MAHTAKPVVVLFDVDETLVHTGGSGARSWKAAFDELYGIPADIGAHTSAGETDPEVARATFKGVLNRDPSDDELDRLYAHYLLHLADDIGTSEGYRVLPGAEQTLLSLGKAGVMLALVSGAMEGAARTKLIPANLNRFFMFGAYGSDSADRAELTGIAIEKASRCTPISPRDRSSSSATRPVTWRPPKPPERYRLAWPAATIRRRSWRRRVPITSWARSRSRSRASELDLAIRPGSPGTSTGATGEGP